MADNITKLKFTKTFNIERLITLFYMEISKDFYYEGESHNYWEMVYIDKGEAICTADKNKFILKSGELVFHKPNEFHNLSGNGSVSPNVGIITFVSKSREMKYFIGKIFKLSAEEKTILSTLFDEGLSHYELCEEHNPFCHSMKEIESSALGGSQMTKNLIEILLIKLRRNADTATKKQRHGFDTNGIEIPDDLKEVLDCIDKNIYGRMSIYDIANYVGKSESTVKNLFAKFRAQGIIHYYNFRKIEEAKRLIREENYNFTQIAYMLHFETPQYFSKCFKDFTKMTPSEYKSSIVRNRAH